MQAQMSEARKTAGGPSRLGGAFVTVLLCLLLPSKSGFSELRAAGGDLLGRVPFPALAPQDIAFDPTDETYFVTTFLDNVIYHLDSSLSLVLEQFPSPFGDNSYPTGICYNSHDDTLYVAEIGSGGVAEIHKDGVPTGRPITPQYLVPAQISYTPTVRGMDFNPRGNGGAGSFFLVEMSGTLIYEFDLSGRRLRYFSHPDDPDGFPGFGRQTSASDVAVIYDGEGTPTGFYVTGGVRRVNRLRRLNFDGEYIGISVTLEDAAGNVSGIIRRPFPEPRTGQLRDSYICVVESNAEIAILEGGEPQIHEIVGLTCKAEQRDLQVEWTTFEVYDSIEVFSGCDLLATLPGDATQWQHTFAGDGDFELYLRATRGGDSVQTAPCRFTTGPGQVIRSADVQDALLVDITCDDTGLLLATDAENDRVMVFSESFTPLSFIELNPEFVADDGFITGIAFDSIDRRLFVMNAATSQIGEFEETGALVRVFDAALPNLAEDPEEEPDRGFVYGLAFDPGGDGDRGSLWALELVEDQIYELDLDGGIIHNFPHPYRLVDPPPPDTPFGTTSSALSLVAGNPDELLVSGGGFHDGTQVHILRINKQSGSPIAGSVISTRNILSAGESPFFGFTSILDSGRLRLAVSAFSRRLPRLLWVDATTLEVAPPTHFHARQPSFVDRVELEFRNHGPYDKIEILRDCEPIGSASGTATSFVDASPAQGLHEYAVRGVSGAAVSDVARDSVRVGPGAVLSRRLLWPARSPQQLAVDPVTGHYFVVVNYPGEERLLYRYDGNFAHVETRETSVAEPWQIATAAIRLNPAGERELNFIIWKQPVPIGQAASQRFFLHKETMAGELLEQIEISPPIPPNGFIVYPTGLSWEPASDTFFYLERNSKTFIHMDADGQTLSEFPHPSPPFQNFVFNIGMDAVPERGTLFITGSERLDHKVTKVWEMTHAGELTGVEIPVGELPVVPTGIAIRGPELIAVGTGRFSEIVRVKAFDELPEPFLRGDSNGDGAVQMADALFTLGFLFKGTTSPPCMDAADSDDSGSLNINDGILILLRLFAGAAPLPEPYPAAGQDPTPDAFVCF